MIFPCIYQDYGPNYAIDGVIFKAGGTKIFHSLKERRAWLQIELVEEFTVIKVAITNRKDSITKSRQSVAKQLSDFFIYINNNRAVQGKKMEGGFCGYFEGGSWYGGVHVIKCQQPKRGKFLTVQNKDMGKNRFIQINEVEAYTSDC